LTGPGRKPPIESSQIMKININYPQLAAEFVIVFVGVAVALAADSWREDLNNYQLESEYLQRLLVDLEAATQPLERNVERGKSSSDSVSALLQHLDSSKTISDEDLLIRHIAFASLMGNLPTGLARPSDITFEELKSTGRLNLVRDSELRAQLADYYRRIDDYWEFRASFPVTIQDKYRENTGVGAPELVFGNRLLENEARNRLLVELEDRTEYSRELRLLAPRLNYSIVLSENLVASNNLLVERIRQLMD